MLGIVILCASLGVGAWCMRICDPESRCLGFVRLWGGWMLGICVSGFVALIGALVTRNLFTGLALAAACSVCASAYGAYRMIRARTFLKHARDFLLWIRHLSGVETVLGIAMIGVVCTVAIQAMLFDQNGFAYGVLKGWGDGAYHLGMVRNLSQASPFVLQQPIAAGLPLTYPFFVNFLSAMLLRGGLPLAYAWHIPVILFGIGMIAALYAWARQVLGRKILAGALVWVAICGGGLGFIFFGQVVARDAARMGLVQAVVQNIRQPQYEYTHLDIRTGGKPQEKAVDQNIVWIVPLISFFSHQRSFVLGAAIGFFMLYGLWAYRGSRRQWRWLALLGFVPLIHMHTFMALGIIAFVWIAYEQPWREAGQRTEFTRWAVVACAIALPQLVFLYRGLFTGSEGQGFFAPWIGWMTCTHVQSWIACDPAASGVDHSIVWFWVKNFGAVCIAWVASLGYWAWRCVRRMPVPRELFVLFGASIALFAIPNVVKLQPWEFDNNKMLLWWWVLAIALVLWMIGAMRRPYSYIMLACFVVFASMSGALDVWARVKSGLRLDANVRNFGYYGASEVVVAQWISTHTAPSDVFLTHSQANQFIPMLTGRPIYLGFPGWLWTQGHAQLISQRQDAIHAFMRTGDATALCRDGVSYILWDGQFRRDYGDIPQKGVVLKFSHRGASGEYRVYQLQCI